MVASMKHMALRVINNFGLDFKAFTDNDQVLEKICDLAKNTDKS